MKASDLFVRCLEAEGVEYVFGVPGEENLDLLESLRQSSIELIVTRHEQGAGFMAATYGRLTGKAGVVLTTLGPGATNLFTAAAFAQLGAMPLVMITGQKPIRQPKQGAFQILDIVEMMGPVTKFSRQVASGAFIPARVREAFRLAQEERPGATHLELPEDIATEAVDAAPLRASAVRRPVAEDKAIEAAVERIEQARRPLLVIAAGANRKMTANMLRQFVDAFGIPFVTTQMGKGVVDETGEAFIGNTAISDKDFVHRAIDAADLIINVGHEVVEKPPFIMKNDGVSVIHIDFNTAQVDPVYFPQVEVTGDIGNAIWQIKQRLQPQAHWDFEPLKRIARAADTHFASLLDNGDFPLRPERLVADLREVMPDDGILALDNGIYKIWIARNYRARKPNTVLLDNALATMGAGLPAAMGARLVYPDRPIVAVCGDGGFMMNSQELETAVRLGQNLVVLVLRDDGYGMIRWKQEEMGYDDYGLDYGNPDFVRYAESYGANGYRVDSADAFTPLLKDCIGRPGVHLIDVPVDYSQNDRLLHREIPELAAKC